MVISRYRPFPKSGNKQLRIDQRAVEHDAPVQVRAGHAGEADALAPTYCLADCHTDTVKVAIHAKQAAAVAPV